MVCVNIIIVLRIDESGFLSHALVVDNGRLVFKFPKVAWANYKNEARVLKELDGRDLGVRLQKLNHLCPDGSYICLDGIIGESIKTQTCALGLALGRFLKKLHAQKIDTDYGLWLNAEIAMWQARYKDAQEYFSKHFSAHEIKILNKLICEYLPNKLRELGEDLVFSHHDLNMNNVIITGNKIGVIDFEHAGIYDRATDFMSMPDGVILEYMVKSYGADEVLKQKIKYRREMRTIVIAHDHGIDPERVRAIINLYRFCE